MREEANSASPSVLSDRDKRAIARAQKKGETTTKGEPNLDEGEPCASPHVNCAEAEASDNVAQHIHPTNIHADAASSQVGGLMTHPPAQETQPQPRALSSGVTVTMAEEKSQPQPLVLSSGVTVTMAHEILPCAPELLRHT